MLFAGFLRVFLMQNPHFNETYHKRFDRCQGSLFVGHISDHSVTCFVGNIHGQHATCFVSNVHGQHVTCCVGNIHDKHVTICRSHT